GTASGGVPFVAAGGAGGCLAGMAELRVCFSFRETGCSGSQVVVRPRTGPGFPSLHPPTPTSSVTSSPSESPIAVTLTTRLSIAGRSSSLRRSSTNGRFAVSFAIATGTYSRSARRGHVRREVARRPGGPEARNRAGPPTILGHPPNARGVRVVGIAVNPGCPSPRAVCRRHRHVRHRGRRRNRRVDPVPRGDDTRVPLGGTRHRAGAEASGPGI